MQLINTNRVKSAKFQLSQHRVQGERSSLSILQVAHLMDVVKNEGEMNHMSNGSVFFSWN
ncbi:MAG: hypothetical protein HRT58_14430 [Crocinitomicaceae bacterium]|nr:hypothetical protein [Flavobacteriales bacterium]NQZ36863.1 hypothetical protein [Crocinitomicaceae bacterium]PHR34984.1 MAG: hypothetical protein COA38_03365 [Fluviicola sp.]